MPTTEKSPEFYKHYPALFHTYFPTISAETLHLLCVIPITMQYFV